MLNVKVSRKTEKLFLIGVNDELSRLSMVTGRSATKHFEKVKQGLRIRKIIKWILSLYGNKSCTNK